MSEKVTLSGVPETMLQTVYARAKESATRGAITDKKAEEIIGKLHYDFSLAEKDTAMRSGVIARTIVLDKLVNAFLAAHPGAIVVNIACGLDTRCYRWPAFPTGIIWICQKPSPCAKSCCRRAAQFRKSPYRPWTIGAVRLQKARSRTDRHRGADHVFNSGGCAAHLRRNRPSF